jgi:hypothetical protein
VIKITMEYATAEDAILMLSALREKGYDVPTTDAKTKPKPTVKDVTDGVKVVKETPDGGKSVKTATAAQLQAIAQAEERAKADAAPVTKVVESSDSSTAIEYPVVSAAITAAVGTHGRDAVLALLKDGYGAKSGKDLKPEQYAEFLEKLEAIGAKDDLS